MQLHSVRRFTSLFLVCTLLASGPLFAAERPIHDAIGKAAHEAAGQSQRPASRGDNPYLVPGLVLLGVGGTVLLYGLIVDTGVSCKDTATSFDCGTTKSKAAIAAGAAISGTGAILLMKGERARDRAVRPEVTFKAGAAMLRTAIRW